MVDMNKMTAEQQDEEFFAHAEQMCKKVLTKLRRKRADYGRDNILRHREYGVLVRKDDKMSRVSHLLQPGVKAQVDDETIADTLIDDIGYDLIMLALLEDKW